MNIHILQAKRKLPCRTNKDTNGGYGTVNDFGDGLVSRLLAKVKSKAMNFPELAPAYASAILKSQGHSVTYGDNEINKDADITLFQTSIVHYNEELAWARKVRKEHPHSKIGFFAGVTDVFAEKYLEEFDFVITGEFESALLGSDITTMEGKIHGAPVANLDDIPFPDWSHVGSGPKASLVTKRLHTNLFPATTSRGCPMSCRFYCTYPLTQGIKQRQRSVKNVVDELEFMQSQYGMNLTMFRDPIFSLDMKRTKELCREMIDRKIDLAWICETHTQFLDEELIDLLAEAGCKAIKVGIESGNEEVMNGSKRKTQAFLAQKKVVDYCEKRRIKILAFYILGYFHDSLETMNQTIEHAMWLNSYGAQFTVATPYPGTPWYKEMEKEEGRVLSSNLDDYTQYSLVYNHPNLVADDIEKMKNKAYRRYYTNIKYLAKHHLLGSRLFS